MNMNKDMHNLAVTAYRLWDSKPWADHPGRYICNCLKKVHHMRANHFNRASEYYTLTSWVNRRIELMPSVDHLLGVGGIPISRISEEDLLRAQQFREGLWNEMILLIESGELR